MMIIQKFSVLTEKYNQVFVEYQRYPNQKGGIWAMSYFHVGPFTTSKRSLNQSELSDGELEMINSTADEHWNDFVRYIKEDGPSAK